MKKLLSVLICVLLGVTSVFAYDAEATVDATLSLYTQPQGSGYVKTEKTALTDFSDYLLWSVESSSVNNSA